MRTKGAKREVHLYEIMRRINEKMNKKLGVPWRKCSGNKEVRNTLCTILLTLNVINNFSAITITESCSRISGVYTLGYASNKNGAAI